MKSILHLFPVCLALLYAFSPLHAQTTGTDSLFRSYYDNAVTFADLYPREKAYLHFDNTSYYVGDTIWFKAYVTLAETHRPSRISKPLYVEMVDQMGHVTQRQIFELDNGECNGQLILDKGTLSGYYEIRAYTRWMQAFAEPNYFSRTFPVYQAARGDDFGRAISTYDLNPSMRQRPEKVTDRLALQFFPEGGSLVQGLPTKVAFKAESRDSACVSLKGAVCTRKGDTLAVFQTMHDGMGVFAYTPVAEKVKAKVYYNNKEYTFDLPDPLEAGYVLNVNNAGSSLVMQVAGNASTPANRLCAMVSYEGRPQSYWTLDMQPGARRTFVFRTDSVKGGVYQISLIDVEGRTLCERFAFMQPRQVLAGTVEGVKDMYMPYEPVKCEVRFTDTHGQPLQGNFSISVRDALRSDYGEYDNNIYTDMLLTSGLKGYIHQPGYYFADTDVRKLQELDVLMMVHGWRQYDMSQLTSGKPAELLQYPETSLMLNGQIRSSVLQREMKNMEVSVIVLEQDSMMVGSIVTDSVGRFSIPLTGINGEVEAVFQTRRNGQKRKRETAVRLDRNFAPAPRAYGYAETHPEWMEKEGWEKLSERADSLYMDSLLHVDVRMLDEVAITAKSKNRRVDMTTQVYEKSVEAYYDVARIVDEMRDKGKAIFTMTDLLNEVDPNFSYNPRNENCMYKNRTICLIFGNEVLDPISAWGFWNEIDGVKRLMICQGSNSFSNEVFDNTKTSNLDTSNQTTAGSRSFDDEFYAYSDADKAEVYGNDDSSDDDSSTQMTGNINRNISLSRLGEYALFYLEPKEGITEVRMREKNMRAARGTRRTYIQGYTRPLAFYAPAYTDTPPAPVESDYRRRTLYWNPCVQTDSDGRALIECSNGMYSNPIIVQAEMLKDGMPCSVTVMSEGIRQ